MPSGYEKEDLESFFEVDGVGVLGRITGPGPPPFALDIKGVFDLGWQDVSVYAETGVDTDEPVFECATVELVGVKKGMALTMPDLEAHEDGFGVTYKIERLAPAGVQSTRIFLRAL